MKRKRLIAAGLTVVMAASLMVGCGSKNASGSSSDAGEGDSGVKEFTAFFAVPGDEINDDNEIQQKIAEITGAKCKETWLTGQTAEEAIGVLIAGGEYPDYIVGGNATQQLIDSDALVPIDEYWDEYPNIKNYLSDLEWDQVRAEDGHVYLIPEFGIINGEDMECTYNDEAFWIQTRVLKWAGYPEIKTLDQYFDLIEDYLEANPTSADGQANIGYECLCDDWRYFCIENAPQFLDGHPNDGCCMVDDETAEVSDYNTSDTAVRYFQKLNEEYQKGVIDPETFTNSYDQYIAKLSTGTVLAMCDQHWDFQSAEQSLKSQKLEGCTYVPLGLTIDEGIEERYHSKSAMDVSDGLSITTSCEDVEGALQFVNDLLGEEVQTLRYWGIEGVDYLVGDDGVFYRDETMRENAVDSNYKASHLCSYSYFPHYEGTSLDGINAWTPGDQPQEFFDSLDADVQECLEAYGARTYCEMLNPPAEENTAWYPMWSYANALTTDSEAGLAKTNMDEVKHEYLPKVVMAEDFDAAWEEYMGVFNDRVDLKAYIDDLQKEVNRRIDVAESAK